MNGKEILEQVRKSTGWRDGDHRGDKEILEQIEKSTEWRFDGDDFRFFGDVKDRKPHGYGELYSRQAQSSRREIRIVATATIKF